MKKIALITGITGQDGSYLAELLLEKGYEVHGIIRRVSYFNTSRIDHLVGLNLIYGDVLEGIPLHDFKDFDRLEIYNLAAQSHVQVSFQVPEYTLDTDAKGVLKILESIRIHPLKDRIRFYQAGTSEMFGDVLETPQNENTPFNPVSPYACAKVCAHYLVKTYREGYDIFACNGILFNHESPRRGENFVTKKIVDSIKRDGYVTLGNLDSKRDWGHAAEYVEGMWMMLQHSKPDDFVLATGHTHSIREFCEIAFTKIGIYLQWGIVNGMDIGFDQHGEPRVRTDPKYYRPCEVNLLLGDASKARKVLGWKPTLGINEIIDDLFANSYEI